MLIVPSPPLPAGTLLGATGVATVMVNCDVTGSTDKAKGSDTVVLGDVPVMVTLYKPGVVGVVETVELVVMVAVAPPDGFTDEGLTVQAGRLTPAVSDVTAQLRVTLPVNPFSGASARIDAESSPGSTATGLKGAAVMVKS